MTDLLEKPEVAAETDSTTETNVYIWDLRVPGNKQPERHCVYFTGRPQTPSATADMLVESIKHKSRKIVHRNDLSFVRKRKDTICNQTPSERCHYF